MRDSVLEAVVLDGALGPATDTTQRYVPQGELEKSPVMFLIL